MSLPKLYVETTIPSYLTARRSRNLRLAADQQTTEEWWEAMRHEYELFVSEAVLEEVGAGEANLAARRLALLAGLPRLSATHMADALAGRLLTSGIIPETAAADAVHLALAAAHGMDFLLTWNCKHIHNVRLERRIEVACRVFGFTCPIILHSRRTHAGLKRCPTTKSSLKSIVTGKL